MPVGPLSSLGPEEAAVMCSEYLQSYHTLIPLVMRLNHDESLLHRDSVMTFSPET